MKNLLTLAVMALFLVSCSTTTTQETTTTPDTLKVDTTKVDTTQFSSDSILKSHTPVDSVELH
jgi:PBP1b-binding outer membrane lipoprotein LpoB